jgi:hypothetical protein
MVSLKTVYGYLYCRTSLVSVQQKADKLGDITTNSKLIHTGCQTNKLSDANWNQDDKASPNIPSPVGHGWSMESTKITPVYYDLPCAPDSTMKLIRYSCSKNRCTHPYTYSASNLRCTAMCVCGGSEELCDNQSNVQLSYPDDDSDNDVE